MNIKYRQLKAFLLAVETRSFTRAADELGVTQPSFTALIRDLEKVLDIRLFDRTTRSLVLTRAGGEFRDRIQRPIADLEEAYRSMADLAAVRRGAIVIGVLPSTALTLVPPTLGKLRLLHPALQVQVIEAHNDELIGMLRINQVEFVLATVLDAAPDLDFKPLLQDGFVAAFPSGHPASEHAALTWSDLVPYDLILLSRGSSARSQFERAVSLDNGPSGQRVDVTNMTTAVLLAKQGLGVAVLPRLALPALHLEDLSWRPVQDGSAQRTIGLIHRKDREMSPAGSAFFQVLRGVAHELRQVEAGGAPR